MLHPGRHCSARSVAQVAICRTRIEGPLLSGSSGSKENGELLQKTAGTRWPSVGAVFPTLELPTGFWFRFVFV